MTVLPLPAVQLTVFPVLLRAVSLLLHYRGPRPGPHTCHRAHDRVLHTAAVALGRTLSIAPPWLAS